MLNIISGGDSTDFNEYGADPTLAKGFRQGSHHLK